MLTTLTPTVAPGTVAHFAAATPPGGWLKANGAAVSRTTYGALFNVIGTTYGAGDGATTFNVPDLRGEFVRGFDDARGVDAGRAIGSPQTHQLQGHNHIVDQGGFGQVSSSGAAGGSNTNYAQGSANSGLLLTAKTIQTDGTNGVPNVGAETRPRNVALLACIKY